MCSPALKWRKLAQNGSLGTLHASHLTIFTWCLLLNLVFEYTVINQRSLIDTCTRLYYSYSCDFLFVLMMPAVVWSPRYSELNLPKHKTPVKIWWVKKTVRCISAARLTRNRMPVIFRHLSLGLYFACFSRATSVTAYYLHCILNPTAPAKLFHMLHFSVRSAAIYQAAELHCTSEWS